jgi:hypothetical protein
MTDPADIAPRVITKDISHPNSGSGLQDLAKLLWTHNPFYLISLALVLHSTRLWHHDSIDGFNPWPLMSIMGGYLLLMSVTGFLLVKLGRVWDDARSIFLVIMLLFLELSLIFDEVLLHDSRTGMTLMLSGWLAAATISECLLLGLRIRLPWTFRGPYHLLLALMFLYPAVVILDSRAGEPLVWRIFWFTSSVGIALLCLVPAVHQGRTRLMQNGTPWAWPWYPWTMFGFLTICLGLRAWALTLSFDPVTSQGLADAMQMQGTFGGDFLIPMVLAIGVLLLEAGFVERRRILAHAGLIAPALCLILALPYGDASAPYLEFRNQFAERFGSPLWVTWNACWAFYTFAFLRGSKLAIAGMLGSAVAIMVFGRFGSVHPQSYGIPALPLLVSTALILAYGWRRFDSRIFVPGLIGAYLAGRDLMPTSSNPLVNEAIAWNLACAGILLSGLLFQDRAAKYWQRLGMLLIALNCGLAAFLPIVIQVNLPVVAPLAYCLVASSLIAAYAWVTSLRECRYALLACGAFTIARLMIDATEMLKKSFHWDGALYFVVGMGTFAVAVSISTLKSTKAPQPHDIHADVI